MNLEQWLLYHQSQIVFRQCSWMGVRIYKNPLDAWIYQEIIYETTPDVIVEIGSADGGSTLYLAHLLDLIGNGSVISIDISRHTFQVTHPRIVTITGDSSSSEVVERARALCRDRRVLVIHDGDHRVAQVLSDLRNYAPLVNVGSYVIVEDGIVDLYRSEAMSWGDQDGPLPAVEQFLAENRDFVVDPSRERYILTYNPKGFLKRVRS
jgi:cephalosporin hydroxylase